MNPVRFDIAIILKSEEEGIKFVNALKKITPHVIVKNHFVDPADYRIRKKEDRQRMIYDSLIFGRNYRIGVLFKALKMKMAIEYKTFQRDIKDLRIKNKIKTEVFNGGLSGKTTIIRKKKW